MYIRNKPSSTVISQTLLYCYSPNSSVLYKTFGKPGAQCFVESDQNSKGFSLVVRTFDAKKCHAIE